MGLAWWSSGKECREHRFNPWFKLKIPRAVGQLNPCTTAAELATSKGGELQLLSPQRATSEAHTPSRLCSTTREAIAVRSPYSTTRE